MLSPAVVCPLHKAEVATSLHSTVSRLCEPSQHFREAFETTLKGGRKTAIAENSGTGDRYNNEHGRRNSTEYE